MFSNQWMIIFMGRLSPGDFPSVNKLGICHVSITRINVFSTLFTASSFHKHSQEGQYFALKDCSILHLLFKFTWAMPEKQPQKEDSIGRSKRKGRTYSGPASLSRFELSGGDDETRTKRPSRHD
jgi:hypothetical protein